MNVQILEPTANQNDQPADTLSPPANIRRLVLTGFMGAGKTTIGRLLAERLGWEFIDLDAAIESSAALTVPEIFAAHGEAHFRKLESQALAAALGREKSVLALGGGAPESLTNRLLLEQTPATAIIFLDAPFTTLFDRCLSQSMPSGSTGSAAEARPNLADPAAARARYDARHPIYCRLAHHTIDTTSLTTEETATTLLTHLHLPKPRRR